MPNLSLKVCVLVGRMNPAIVAPNWLVAQGILPDGVEGEAYGPVGTTIMAFEAGGYGWTSTTSRLQVGAMTDDADPGDFVARVISLLSHTPVVGVGNNFTFEFEEDEGAQLYRRLSPSLGGLLSAGKAELEFSVGTKLGSEHYAVVSVDITGQNERVATAALNFHREVRDAEKAAAAARLWQSDMAEAQRLVGKLVEENANADRNG